MRPLLKPFFSDSKKDKICSVFFKFSFWLVFFCFWKDLSADTLILRNGIEYKNVKTTLGKAAVTIESESGSIINIPISSIKSIKSIPVQWGSGSKSSLTPEEENRTSENDASKDLSKNNRDQSSSSPLKNSEIAKLSFRDAFPSLIPGWSNLYRLGYPTLGALFSISELYLVHLISLYSKPTVRFYDDPLNLLFSYANLDPNVSSQNPKFISLVFSYENASLVKDPISGGYTTPGKIKEGRERAVTGLISVLILDFSITQVISMTIKKKEMVSKESGSFEIKFGSRFRPEVGESESKISLVYYF